MELFWRSVSAKLGSALPLHDFEKTFDCNVLIEFTRNHAEIPVFAVALYMVLVFYVPTLVTKPINLKVPFAVWNIFLSAFSVIGVTRCVPVLIDALLNHGFLYTVCNEPGEWYLVGPQGLWVGIFILSKIPELLDTAFLVLQKKNVIFLHWFHHTTVLLYCWHAFHTRIATGMWFAAMNFTVHTIMYAYYAVSFMGMSRFARPLAPLITMLQILQMVVGSTVTGYSAYMHHTYGYQFCHVDPANYKMGLAMYMSYLVLFAMLFFSNYLASNAKHKVSRNNRNNDANNKDKNEICGVDVTMDTAGFFHGAVTPKNDNDKKSK